MVTYVTGFFQLTPEEAEKFGIKMKTGADKPTLESEYEVILTGIVIT